jgi:hypothetical protein
VSGCHAKPVSEGGRFHTLHSAATKAVTRAFYSQVESLGFAQMRQKQQDRAAARLRSDARRYGRPSIGVSVYAVEM